MHIERADGQEFVLASARDALPGILSRKKRLKKIRQYADSHKASRVVVLPDGKDYTAVFSQEPGQLLGETARQYFEDPSLVWVDQCEPGRYLLVILSGSEVVDEQLVDDAGVLDLVALEMFLESHTGDIDPVVYGSGGLPRALCERLQNAGADLHHRFDESLLDQLPRRDELLTQPVAEYLLAEQKDMQRKQVRTALAALVPVALGLLFALWPESDTPESVIPFTDPYADYRALYQRSRATDIINEIYELVTLLENLSGWHLGKCDYKERRLVCVLSPALGARSGLLGGMEPYLRRPTETHLVGDRAHVVIDLIGSNREPEQQRLLIVNRQEALRTFRDRLVFLPVPNAIDIKPPVDQTHWEEQQVETLKQGTGLYHMVDLSRSANGLPVRLHSLAIRRQEAGHEFRANFIVFGSKTI